MGPGSGDSQYFQPYANYRRQLRPREGRVSSVAWQDMVSGVLELEVRLLA